MKQKIFIYFALIAIAFSVSIRTLADDGIYEDSFYSGITIKPKDKQGNRPLKPEFIPIQCHYEDGILYFEFERDLGMCDVIVTNSVTNHVKSFRIDSSFDSEIFVGPLESAYIEIYTATGHEYEGYLE